MINVDSLIEGAKVLDIRLTDKAIESFILYKKLLIEWNKKINITSIEDQEEIDIKHFLDSITPLTEQAFSKKVNLIDIGTGGGFPGIPLKIINNELHIVLLDSLNKRIKFLDEVIEKLNLENIKTIHGRAEDYGKDISYRETFDICISRAVAPLNILAEYCLPFVKVGGYFVAMKGPNVDDELEQANGAIKILGGKFKEKKNIMLPNSDIEHSLIFIEKVAKTPTKYPRKPGKPKKKPL